MILGYHANTNHSVVDPALDDPAAFVDALLAVLRAADPDRPLSAILR